MRKFLVFLLIGVVSLGSWARTGAWVDEVVITMEPSHAKAVDMLVGRAIDLYAAGIVHPGLVKTIVEKLGYEILYGVVWEITFNPHGPEYVDGRLNPFSVPAIREAMNWLIDRDYIVAEFMGGVGGVPRFFAIHPAFPDYARYADVARALELKYAHNPEKAKKVIFAEMEKLGAEFKDGKWYYKGKPVLIKVLIRPEDERKQIGDYVATLLEGLGFTVERDYKRAAEAAPIWLGGDPKLGLFDVYTGGWIATVISRDQGGTFDFYYTPRGRAELLWQAYNPKDPDPEFDKISERLALRDYKDLEERRELFAKVLEYSMRNSVRIFVANRVGRTPRAKDLRVAADLAGGVAGGWLWALTLRWEDRIGGTVRIAQPSVLTDPWNPVDGSNWIFDVTVIRATADFAVVPDPFTGLFHPQRLERAEVYVLEGLPVGKTLDWVDLKFVPKIEVPGDAWYDWDPVAQRFITVKEAKPEGLTAKTKTVVYFPADLYECTWHDGTKITFADCLLPFILTFERANEKSKIYDEGVVPAFKIFRKHFQGLRVLSVNPLVFEVYSDLMYLDAEYIAYTRANYLVPFYPAYSQGTGSWHKVALGIQAEEARKLTFSSGKAKKLGVDWMNYLAGPSVPILAGYLKENIETGYIPYEPTLGQYVTKEEAIARYKKLLAWYEAKGHLWVGSGPLYVDLVKPVEKIIVLKRFEAFPDPAEKWVRFAEPWIAKVAVTAPVPMFKVGKPWDFHVEVMFKDLPYPVKDIDFVTYLLFDAEDRLVLSGRAEPVKDGLFVIMIPAKETAKLPAGPIRLEVVVVSKLVAIPSFAKATFTAIP